MNEINNLKHQADIGEDFKTFLGNQVGKYIIDRAEAEEKVVFREMAKADPNNSSEIAMLQIKAQVPRQVINWLRDVVKQGADAQYILQSMEAENDEI